mmetsp:Transcript_38574/g.90618  ORF Transcript_38574/g.90618 Transcript_38574/m.90618 type:complete len:228 (+) Transcript_38574:24-707(+)
MKSVKRRGQCTSIRVDTKMSRTRRNTVHRQIICFTGVRLVRLAPAFPTGCGRARVPQALPPRARRATSTPASSAGRVRSPTGPTRGATRPGPSGWRGRGGAAPAPPCSGLGRGKGFRRPTRPATPGLNKRAKRRITVCQFHRLRTPRVPPRPPASARTDLRQRASGSSRREWSRCPRTGCTSATRCPVPPCALLACARLCIQGTVRTIVCAPRGPPATFSNPPFALA